MTTKKYQGGEYRGDGGGFVWGSGRDGKTPIPLAPSRANITHYDPEKVLVPDQISDACARLVSWCIFHKNPFNGEEIRIGDLGSGSGIFATGVINGLTLPTEVPFGVHVIDDDIKAILNTAYNLEIAVNNAPRPIILEYSESDYLESLNGTYDFLFFNPPYLEEGDLITHKEAQLAPKHALYVVNSTQEYERVVPYLKNFLRESGMAIVRLPREDVDIDA